MKRKNISSIEKDPPLCDGLGYLTKNAPYHEYLEKNKNVTQEVSDNYSISLQTLRFRSPAHVSPMKQSIMPILGILEG